MPGVLELGTRFRTIRTPAPAVPYDSGNTRSVELPRTFLFKDIAVRLTGSLNVTVATTNRAESPLGLIAKMELVADGRKTLWTAAGRDLYRHAHIFYSQAGELSAPATGVGATQAFSATIMIPNESVRTQMPADSLFDPREYEKIELRITWSSVSSIISAGTATVNTGCQASVVVYQTTQGAEYIKFNRVIQFDELTFSASSTALSTKVARSGLLAGILIRVDDANQAPDDTVINSVTLRSDNSFYHADTWSWREIQERNVIDYQLGSRVAGYGYIDLLEDGLLSSALNTLALNVAEIILNVTAAAAKTVRFTYVFYEPIQQLAA